jgi:hypothetical protein
MILPVKANLHTLSDLNTSRLLTSVRTEAAVYAAGQLAASRSLDRPYDETAFRRGLNCARRMFLRDLCRETPAIRHIVAEGIRAGLAFAKSR